MLRKTVASLVAVLVVGAAASARAQVSQSVSLNVGYFALRAVDARPADDVLVQNLNYYAFYLKDFNGPWIEGNYLVGIGDFIDAGVGVGYHRRNVPSVYLEYVNADGSEIAQDFKLSVAPVSFTVRILPLGRHAPIQPYVGVGIAAYKWRYSESGQFIDFNDNNNVFRNSYVDSGTKTGPVFLGGARIPVGDVFAIGGEFQYQKAEATLNPDLGYTGTKIDLGGYVSQLTFQLRF
jgi:hypothetical protein